MGKVKGSFWRMVLWGWGAWIDNWHGKQRQPLKDEVVRDSGLLTCDN